MAATRRPRSSPSRSTAAGCTRSTGRAWGDTSSSITGVSNSVYGNFRYNAMLNPPVNVPSFGPNSIGMDEDYDACDLENWFLAIQSADGQVMIPSFHRPAIIRIRPGNVTRRPSTTGALNPTDRNRPRLGWADSARASSARSQPTATIRRRSPT